MSIAVGILLFVCTALTLYRGRVARRDSEKWLMLFFSIINFAAGIMSIVSDGQSLQIGIGVLLSVWTIVALVLLIYAARESVGGPNSGLGIVLVLVAALFFAWVTTFMVLQFAIVV